jgi:hypothetical protein
VFVRKGANVLAVDLSSAAKDRPAEFGPAVVHLCNLFVWIRFIQQLQALNR